MGSAEGGLPDLFRCPCFLPICSGLRSLFAGMPRLVLICSDLLRLLPICSDLFSEQIRTNQGNSFSADPFCKSPSSLRQVLANLRGRAKILEITVPKSRKEGLSYKCANYPCRNYPLTSARILGIPILGFSGVSTLMLGPEGLALKQEKSPHSIHQVRKQLSVILGRGKSEPFLCYSKSTIYPLTPSPPTPSSEIFRTNQKSRTASKLRKKVVPLIYPVIFRERKFSQKFSDRSVSGHRRPC